MTQAAAPDYGIDATTAQFERMPNVHFKFTDIVHRFRDQAAEPAQSVRMCADRFGAGRLMWGFDLGASVKAYATKAAMAQRAARMLTAGERRCFPHDTAARVYAR